MGTEITELEKKQNELKYWIKKIGFSQNKFAQHFCNDMMSEHEEDIEKFPEAFKKQLQRKTTKVNIIDKYLEFLFTLSEFEELNKIKLNYIVNNNFGDIFNKRMKKISKNITNKLKDKY